MDIKKFFLFLFYFMVVAVASHLYLNSMEYNKIGPQNHVITKFFEFQKKAEIFANDPVTVQLRSDKIFQAKIDGILYICEQEPIGTYHIPHIKGNINEIEILDNHATVYLEVSSESEEIQVWVQFPLVRAYISLFCFIIAFIIIWRKSLGLEN